MTTPNLKTIEAKAYVPARDFARSLQFYQAVGFTLAWSSQDLACLHHGDASFLLQDFFVQQHAANFQMHLLVENADDWHASLISQNIAAEFGVDIDVPGNRPWGMRDFTLVDPSGVLWRIAHALAP